MVTTMRLPSPHRCLGASRAGAPGGLGGAYGGNGGQESSSGTAGGGGGAAPGGAIFILDGTLTVRDSLFSANSARGGAAGRNIYGGATRPQPGRGEGGAIFAHADAQLVLAGNEFVANEARDGAGSANGDEDVHVMP